MKKKLFSHPEALIATLAIVLLSVLVVFYFWATDAIVVQVHRSLVDAAPQNVTGFDLQAAAKLDLRGLSNPSSSVAAAAAATAIVTVVTPSAPAPVQNPTPIPTPASTPTSTLAPTPTSTAPASAPASSSLQSAPPALASSTKASSTGQ